VSNFAQRAGAEWHQINPDLSAVNDKPNPGSTLPTHTPLARGLFCRPADTDVRTDLVGVSPRELSGMFVRALALRRLRHCRLNHFVSAAAAVVALANVFCFWP
jgi:hypothetical protein